MEIQSNKTRVKEIKDGIAKLYNEQYYQNGTCIFFQDCKKGIQTNINNGYVFSFAARIGENYSLQLGDEQIRIVVVGKENPRRNLINTPPARLIEWENIKRGVNLHYRETYRLLCAMLNYNWDSENRCLADHKKYVYKPDAVLTAFTLTNQYRCAFKDYPDQVRNIKNTPTQEKNCTLFLKNELEVLNPTILVIQTDKLKATDIFGGNGLIPCANIDGFYLHQETGCHIIEMVHPAFIKGWYKENFPRLLDAIDYLRGENKLPPSSYSTTDILNSLVKFSNSGQ